MRLRKKKNVIMEMPTHEKSQLRAIKLININETDCSFEVGKIPTKTQIEAGYFFGQTEVDLYEKVPHPAPRRQYVITIKGKLQFTVTDGSTFIVEPGIILIAEDVNGPGHSWEILEGEEWERIYIPMGADSTDYFIADKG